MRSCHSRLAAPVIASVIAVAAIVGLGPVSAQASAPTPQWATQFGIAGANLTSFGVAVSPNGSSVVGMARYAGTPTIGGTTVTGASAMVKLSATGSIDWVAQTPDAAANAEAITAAPSGTTIIAGYLNGSTTIGGTALASAGGLDIFVAKLAADGSWLWAKSAGGTGADRAYDVRTLPDGSILVTGQFQGTATFGTLTPLVSGGQNDIFVAKMSSNGTWLWATRAGGAGNEGGSNLSVASDGTSVLSGTFDGTTGGNTAPIFGSTPLSSLGISDIYVAKLSADGAWLWAKSAGTTGNDGYGGGRAAALGADGSVFLTGAFAGTMTLGSLSPITRAGNDDIFVAKLTSTGDWVWDVAIGGTATDKGVGVAVQGDGSAVVFASYGNTNLTVGSTTLTRAAGNSGLNLLAARISSSGTWDWATSIASSGSMPIAAGGFGTLSNGAILIGGSFSTNAPAQTVTLGSTVLTSVGVAADTNTFVTCLGNVMADCQGSASAPDAPQSVTASTPADGSTTTSVTFTAPNANGSAITSYTATCTSSTGGTAVNQSGASSPILVAGLTAGATYTCSVTATNGTGTGPASTTSASFTVPSPASQTPAATASAGAPAPAPSTTRATLVVDKVTPSQKGATVTFKTTGPGQASVVGRLRGSTTTACQTSLSVKEARGVTLTCTIGKAQRRAASGSTLTLITTFAPKGSAAVSSTRTVTLGKLR